MNGLRRWTLHPRPAHTGRIVARYVPPAPFAPGERLALWCERLPSSAPEMPRALAAEGERYTEAADPAAALGKKPTGGHWNGGLALLRNNGLVEVSGKGLRAAEPLREADCSGIHPPARTGRAR